MDNLNGRRILVTGASGDIGREIARALARAGADIGLHYHTRRDVAEQVRAEIAALPGRRAQIYRADFTVPGETEMLLDSFCGDFGGIDVLINNAGGIFGAETVDHLTQEAWDLTFALNVKAPFFLSQRMLAKASDRGGKIINISSVSAKYGGGNDTIHYGAAKAALECLTRGLAKSGAPKRVTVNAVRLGIITEGLHLRMGRSSEYYRERVKKIPLGRAGTTDEVAGLVCYLCGAEADFITGAVLELTGGD